MADLPVVIQDIIDGGAVNPASFTYGVGVPVKSAVVGDLYIDLYTKDVYEYSSNDTWNVVWNIGDYANIAAIGDTVVPGEQLHQDIRFIAGDAIDNLAFFFPGICYTWQRPADELIVTFPSGGTHLAATAPDVNLVGRSIIGTGIADNSTITAVSGSDITVSLPTVSAGAGVTAFVPIPDPDPGDPLNVTNRLAAPWVQRAWFSEIRDTYVSTVRYHNGWVPWYGTWPNWVWWDQYSLAGAFWCDAQWIPDKAGTLVTLHLTSEISNRIRPAKTSYHWDLESARPLPPDAANPQGIYDTINTWVTGACVVDFQYTMTKVVRSQ